MGLGCSVRWVSPCSLQGSLPTLCTCRCHPGVPQDPLLLRDPAPSAVPLFTGLAPSSSLPASSHQHLNTVFHILAGSEGDKSVKTSSNPNPLQVPCFLCLSRRSQSCLHSHLTPLSASSPHTHSSTFFSLAWAPTTPLTPLLTQPPTIPWGLVCAWGFGIKQACIPISGVPLIGCVTLDK